MVSAAGDGARLHIAVIGAGSGAFAAAIKATEGGARVTLVEEAELVGGTCVNVGCVPSKILIRAAHLVHLQSDHAFAGLANHRPAIDRAALVAQQQARVEALRRDKYERILETNADIELLKGRARFVDAQTLIVEREDGSRTILAPDRILIASGARPAIPDITGLQDTPYWTSTEALVAQRLPRHLIVIGGSAVAVELAQAIRRLGSQVTLLARSSLLSRADPAIGEGLKIVLEAEGMRILLATPVDAVSHDGRNFRITIDGGDVTGDALLVATGRAPNTEVLALDKAGVATDARGAIVVDDRMRTSVAHVFAAGDCTNQPRLVYVAAAAGARAAINMLGGDAPLDLSAMPEVIFTDPQVAMVGLTEAQAKAGGIDADSRVLALDEVPRALVNFEVRGFIKLVAERKSGRLLGAHVLAVEGGEIIQSAALALRNRMSVRDIADQLFPYLTMVEGLRLCALAFSGDVRRLSCCAG